MTRCSLYADGLDRIETSRDRGLGQIGESCLLEQLWSIYSFRRSGLWLAYRFRGGIRGAGEEFRLLQPSAHVLLQTFPAPEHTCVYMTIWSFSGTQFFRSALDCL